MDASKQELEQLAKKTIVPYPPAVQAELDSYAQDKPTNSAVGPDGLLAQVEVKHVVR